MAYQALDRMNYGPLGDQGHLIRHATDLSTVYQVENAWI